MPDGGDMVTLHEHIEQRIAALEREIALVAESSERARKLAAENLGTRLDGMNHLKEQLRDQQAAAITRQEYEAKHQTLCVEFESGLKLLEGRITALEHFKVALDAKASQQSVNVALGLAVLGMIVSIVLHFV